MVSILKQNETDELLDTHRSLIDRIDLLVIQQDGSLNSRQQSLLQNSYNSLLEILNSPTPTAGGIKQCTYKDTIAQAAHAWINGNSQDLEHSLQNATVQQQHDIEYRAYFLLKEKLPKYSWDHHHHNLATRVIKRYEKLYITTTLYGMPKRARNELKQFKLFRKGKRLNSKTKYTFQWGEQVLTTRGKIRTHGYVCHETNTFVSILDKKGNCFRKKKTNVAQKFQRETIIERDLRLIDP